MLADNPQFLNLSAPFWALIISGVALIFALRRWRYVQRQKMKRMTAAAPREDLPKGVAAEISPRVTSMRDVGVQIQALLTDVEDTARRAAAQVDNRYVKLEILLAEADEKIKRLEELSGAAGERAESVEARRTVALVRETQAGEGTPEAGEASASEPVYQLADGGMNSRDIAQKLGKQPGEVELILALRASGKR